MVDDFSTHGSTPGTNYWLLAGRKGRATNSFIPVHYNIALHSCIKLGDMKKRMRSRPYTGTHFRPSQVVGSQTLYRVAKIHTSIKVVPREGSTLPGLWTGSLYRVW